MESSVTQIAPTATTPDTQPDSPAPQMTDRKPIHSLVIDTGPIIKNDPPVSTLLAQAEELYTIPSVLSEIRDEQTRSRVETTLKPFLKLRSPRPESVKFVTDFARRTGDLEVLSRPDIHLIALTYELECERNGGDWRLRKTPLQKGVNGKPPSQTQDSNKSEPAVEETGAEDLLKSTLDTQDQAEKAESTGEATAEPLQTHEEGELGVEEELKELTLEPDAGGLKTEQDTTENQVANKEAEDPSDDDEDGWITPSNLKKHQEKDQIGTPSQPIQKLLQAAILTSDYSMQNVSLRINLNLLSPSLSRITQVKTWVLRCHGCFAISRKMDKQFCPSCGQATLTRTSCSTDQSGNFKIHLKRNYQHNKRGNVYSVPKPGHGSSNGKHTSLLGGGKNGWGRDLILAEDQKEYVKKTEEEKRTRHRDLMDEDYLPNILTGARTGGNGRIRVGAGRNVNSKKR